MNYAYRLLRSGRTMTTTTNSRQASPQICYIHMHILWYKQIHLHSPNEENSRNKRAGLDGNSRSWHERNLF